MERDTWTFVPPSDGSQNGGNSVSGPSKILAGRFRLLEVLGAGGSGTVWSAEDLLLDERVAIKLLHKANLVEKELARLKREVSTARISHPNMVRIYDLHEAEGFHFLSMELVQGESLSAFLHREATLSVERTIRIGAEIASALAHLHERNIIHRDVKPGNILLTSDGTAKLCDMGLARPMEAGMTLTATDMVVGTPAYMAPEQATGSEPSPASDIYSLGLTLYRCLSGEVPYDGASPLSTLMRRQKERPPRLRGKAPDCPRWLARLIRRMLEPKSRDRPTASVVCAALRRGRYRLRPRRKTVLAAAAVLLIACLVPLAYAHIRRGATARFELGETSVSGVDAEGRRTWNRSMDLPISSSLNADLDGDGVDEMVVATQARGADRANSAAQVQIEALRLNGDVLMSVRPREVIGQWSFPYPLMLDVALSAVDLDLDGRPELVVNARHRTFFPYVLLLYSPKENRWSVLMEHPGWIRKLQFLPDRERPRIRFCGGRNRPLMVPVVGELELRSRAPEGGIIERSRIDVGLGNREAARLSWYTMLDPDLEAFFDRGLSLEQDAGQGLVLVGSDSTTIHLDRWGNVLGASESEEDLHQERLDFLGAISRLETKMQAADAEAVRDYCGGFRERWRWLFQERAYGIGLDLVEAHALARSEDRKGAIRLLGASAEKVPNEDLDYRLANLLAIEGRFGDAVLRLKPMLSRPKTVRATYDTPTLLTRIGIEAGKTEIIEKALHHFRTQGPLNQAETAIRARVYLWWDQPTLAARGLNVVPYEPAAETIDCLLRWRLGSLERDDPELMRQGVEEHPDVSWEFRLAEAAADLGLGRTGEALGLLDSYLPSLQDEAVDDFPTFQLLQLGRALHARALLDTGNRVAAQFEAGQLLKTLTPKRLPAIVAGEVLDEIGKGGSKLDLGPRKN